MYPACPNLNWFKRSFLDIFVDYREDSIMADVSIQGQADLDAGRRSDGLTTEEREEIRRLRRENRQLRQEREILAKAAA